MTQVQQEPAQTGGEGEDLGAGIRRLLSEVQATRDRLRRSHDVTPKKLLQETEGTVLSFFEEFLQYFGSFFDYAVETNDDLNERVEVLEDDAIPPLDEEESNLVLQLAETCEAFVQLYTEGNPNAAPAVKQKLTDATALIARVREWVEEQTGEDEEDDVADGEGENDAGINASGSEDAP